VRSGTNGNPRRRALIGGGTQLFSLDYIRVRTWMWGPRWRSLFGVRHVPLVEVNPIAAPYHPADKKVWLFTLEDDVRERVLEEIRPGVYADWSDPRERFGL
jgi:hypothetical protein